MVKKDCLVSIITSVYNCEKYLPDMVESVISQTYQNWEMIIIDDASTDNTWKILSQYNDSRIKKIQNRENKGLTVNLNKALELATGKYVARIDGDDVAYPRRFEKQVLFMEENPDVVLAGCWMRGFGNQNFFLQRMEGAEETRIDFLFDTPVFHPALIMRKAILDQYAIKYDENFKCAQDYNLEYRLSKYGQIRNIPEILMKYRYHDKQISVEKITEQQKYADKTRKAVLMELGIDLTDEESMAWQKFSTWMFRDVSAREICCIKSILSRIFNANKYKKIYPCNMLTKILFNRLETYTRDCDLWNEGKKKLDEGYDDKYKLMFQMMVQWKRLSQWGVGLENFLVEHDIYQIAIYGMGHIGRVLEEELRHSKVKVRYSIDKRAENAIGTDRINVVDPEDEMEEVDAIIVAVILGYEKIEAMLRQKVAYPIFSLEDIIYSL